MGPRGAGRRLNDQERMEIIEILSRETKVKNVELAKRYGVSEGAIRKLKQMKDTVRDRYFMGNEHNRDKRKRGGFVRNAKFEQELYEWICRMRETQAYQLVPLTQTAVRQQAMLLAKKYESMATFKASPGWFARFCARHRLDPPVHPTMTGEVDPNDITMAASTAAVGDTVPGGPLASAYQVDPSLGVSGVVPVDVSAAAYVGDDVAVDDVSVSVKPAEEAVDLNCSEDVAEQAHLAAAVAAAAAANAEATAAAVFSSSALPVTTVEADSVATVHDAAKDEEEQKAAVKASMPTEDEIFSLGL